MSQRKVTQQTAPPRLHFHVPPEPSHLLRARERVRDYLRQHCTDNQVIDDVVLCVEEAAANAIRHGGSPEDIEIALHFTHTKLAATVKDRGRGFDVAGFDPEVRPDPTSDHGRGLFIVARLMDSLELRLDGGLEVRMGRRAVSCAEPVRFDSSLGDALTGNPRMRAVLEEIDEGFIALDWEYRYTHLNKAMLHLIGKSRDEVLGEVIWKLFPELGDTPVQEHCRAAMELGKPSAIEHRSLLSGDWFEMRIYPTSAGISIYFRDINERKQTEAQLRESQALLRAVLDGSPDPVFVKDQESRIMLGNAALLDVWGKPAQEVIGKNDRELYDDPLIGEAIMENDRAVMASGQSQVLEETVQAPDGLRTYLSTKTPYRAGEGEIVGILGIARDITDRKRVEEALRQSEQKYRTMVETAAEGVVVAGPDGTYTYVNQRMADMLGYAPDEIVGKSIRDLTSDDGALAQVLSAREGLRQGDAVHGEMEFRHKDGSLLWTMYSVSPLLDADGAHIGNLAMHTDITERKQAEEALQQSRAELADAVAQRQLALDAAKLGWWHYDPLTNVSWYDEGYRAIFDITGSQRPNDEILERLYPDDLPGVWASVEAALDPADPKPYVAEYRVYRSDGSLRWVEAHGIAAFEGEGDQRRATSLVGTVQDITARKQAEEEGRRLLEESQAQAEELQTQSEELRVQGEELQVLYDEELADHAALLRENELRAGLSAIGELLHSTLEPDEVMRRALGEATRALAIDAAVIELNEGGAWPVRYAEGLPQEALGAPLTGEPVIARLVAYSGEALVLEDAAGHETIGRSATRYGIRSLVAVPLVAPKEVVGVLLLVERRATRHFAPAEVDFANRLGTIAGLALENARLYAAEVEAQGRLQQELARTTLLNAVAVAATTSVSVAEVARRVFETMAAGLAVKVGTVFSYDAEAQRLVLLASHGIESPYLERVQEVAVAAENPMLISRAVIAGRMVSSDETPLTEARRAMLRQTGVSEHNKDIAVPILAADSAIGVLYFAFDRSDEFSPEELVVLRSLAGVMGQALENARLFEAQSNIAQTLQENFIHPLPAVAGLELGVIAKTAYVPELVGGDFSDVFVLDDSHVVVLIGDVAGKGVKAASLTETVRSKIRAFATIDPAPAFILARTNELMLRLDPDDPHVTAFCAVLDPHTGHLSYASAGHPAPVHLGPFICRPLEVSFGPPLGSFERSYRESHTMLTLEDYLVLYTDGVTEARRDGELLGERRLLEIVAGLRGRGAQEVADAVRDAALAFSGRLRDDLQVVVLRLA